MPILLFSLPTLPPQISVKPVIELRERFERRDDKDFLASNPDSRSDPLSRWRFGLEWKASKAWSGLFQYEYSHDLAWTASRNFSTQASNLYLGFAKLQQKDWNGTLGRQKLTFGNDRLLASSDWGNVARTYDGVRLVTPVVDVFLGRVGNASNRPRHARIGAIQATWQHGKSSVFYKHDKTSGGTIDVWTLDHIWSRRYGKLDLDAEAAIQFGRSVGKEQQAWA